MVWHPSISLSIKPDESVLLCKTQIFQQRKYYNIQYTVLPPQLKLRGFRRGCWYAQHEKYNFTELGVWPETWRWSSVGGLWHLKFSKNQKWTSNILREGSCFLMWGIFQLKNSRNPFIVKMFVEFVKLVEIMLLFSPRKCLRIHLQAN